MFPKTMRVNTHLFSSLMEKGDVRSTSHFSARFHKNILQNKADLTFPKHFSVAIGKKVQKTAVGRSKLRRKTAHALRDAFSKLIEKGQKKSIEQSIDCIIFPKKGAEVLTSSEMRAELVLLLGKVGF